ncbi:hypothetical protein RB653_004016 [Dictyostelium firmibasis]|uniref:Uncharacterized protein n=1 Tax=Dictyostelium firmibasis TaxID=79012 RepID=A0AAN7U6P0_9MYCE
MIKSLISGQFKSIINSSSFTNNIIIKNVNNNNTTPNYLKSYFSRTRLHPDKQKLKERKLLKKKLDKFEYTLPTENTLSNYINDNNIIEPHKDNAAAMFLRNRFVDEEEPKKIVEYIGRRPADIFNSRTTRRADGTGFDHNYDKENDKEVKNIYKVKNRTSNSFDKMYAGIVNKTGNEKLEANILRLKENPALFFENKQNHLMYIKYLSTITRNINFMVFSTWYNFKRSDFTRNHGSELLKLYGDDHVQALISIYPAYNWELWKFPTLNPSFWNVDKNVVKYLLWLIKTTKRDENNLDSCYYLTISDFIANYGQALIHKHDGSLPKIFQTYFPQHDWKLWLFDSPSKQFYKEYFGKKENLKRYLLWLGKDILGYKGYEDFYKLKLIDFKRNHGFPLIRFSFKKSVPKIVLEGLSDEFKWESWRFLVVPNKRTNIEILGEYHNHLYKLLNCSTPNELIEIVDSKLNQNPSIDIIEETGGCQILEQYGGTLKSSFEMLRRKTELQEDDDEEDEEDDNDGFGFQGEGVDGLELKDINEDDFDDFFEIDQKDQHIEQYKQDSKKLLSTKPKFSTNPPKPSYKTQRRQESKRGRQN